MKPKTKRPRVKKRRTTRHDPQWWRQFVAMNDNELATTDVALINLACAVGLPGAEDLNVPRALEEIDRHASRVKRENARNRHRYAEERRRHGDSRAQWTAGMLVTVLQQDCAVRYNPRRIHDPDFTDSRDLFLHGLLGLDSPGGTCASMPFLYVAVGRRLGYPMYVATAKAHLFVRWDDAEGARWKEKDAQWHHRAVFNLEGAATGFHIHADEYYHHWPIPMTPGEIASSKFLNSMTRGQELASILAQRGHCLEDNGQLDEAIEVYAAASRLESAYSFFSANCVRRARGVRRQAITQPPQTFCPHPSTLGD